MPRTLSHYAIACAVAGVAGAASALGDDLQMGFRTWDGDGSGRVGSQMSVTIRPHMDPNSMRQYVDFGFRNDVGVESSVLDLVFRQSRGSEVFAGRGEVLQQMGSTFALGNPAELPPGPLGGYTDAGFTVGSADAAYGLDRAWDSVTIRFALRRGKSFLDLFQAIEDERLLLGARAQTDADALEWYAARKFSMVPLPQTAPLAALGIGALALRRRR